MEPLISVIVPIYRIERYLGICIESILNQTYQNLEIILVDDGSPDRCPAICDLYASKDPRIVVIHKENGGLVSARKTGLLASHGQYIGVVDGDDWIGEGFFRSLLSYAVESGSDAVAAGFTRDLFAQSQIIHNAIPSGIYEGEALTGLFACMISYGDFHTYGITTYLWNKLFRREILLPCQLAVDDRISIGEDAAAVYPALLRCKKICVADNCAYHYRQREDSMLKLTNDFYTEAVSLRIFYRFLSDIFQKYSAQYHLTEQLDDMVLGNFLIRSGGISAAGAQLPGGFPFGAVLREKRVAVCGAGTFGQQLVRRMNERGDCQIVGWYDDDYWEYRRCCMDVDPLTDITDSGFDVVLIAKLDSFSKEWWRRRLLDLGVPDSRILRIEPTDEIKREALRIYLAEQKEGM